MVVGALLVAGLIGWALTRSVEPTASVPPAAVDASATTAPAATDSGVSSVPMTTAATSNPVSPVTTSFDPSFSAPPPQDETSVVPRMAVEDLRAKLNRGGVVVVDVRDQSSFERSHIPGALHIPLASIEANLSQLPKDKPIVTYCT